MNVEVFHSRVKLVCKNLPHWAAKRICDMEGTMLLGADGNELGEVIDSCFIRSTALGLSDWEVDVAPATSVSSGQEIAVALLCEVERMS